LTLYSVYDAEGAHFRMVDEEQALNLLEHRAAIIDGKRRKIRLRLVVDHSAARSLLAPRYQLGQGSRTTIIEYIGDQMIPIYQHHPKRCTSWFDA
jgi:hypothetical protein